MYSPKYTAPPLSKPIAAAVLRPGGKGPIALTPKNKIDLRAGDALGLSGGTYPSVTSIASTASAHQTFSAREVSKRIEPSGQPFWPLSPRHQPTDFVSLYEWRRFANSKLPLATAAGTRWSEVCTGAAWTSPRANQLDTRCEALRHAERIAPPGNTAAERLRNARRQLHAEPPPSTRPSASPRGQRSALWPVPPEVSRFELANSYGQNHDELFRATSMPVDVSIRNGQGEQFAVW